MEPPFIGILLLFIRTTKHNFSPRLYHTCSTIFTPASTSKFLTQPPSHSYHNTPRITALDYSSGSTTVIFWPSPQVIHITARRASRPLFISVGSITVTCFWPSPQVIHITTRRVSQTLIISGGSITVMFFDSTPKSFISRRARITILVFRSEFNFDYVLTTLWKFEPPSRPEFWLSIENLSHHLISHEIFVSMQSILPCF